MYRMVCLVCLYVCLIVSTAAQVANKDTCMRCKRLNTHFHPTRGTYDV